MREDRVFLDNPTLAGLDNTLVRIDPEGTHRVYYHGTVLALWENGEPYLIPGVGEVADVFALEGLIQLLTTDEQLGVDAEPVAPFRIEIVPPGGTPSQPVHHIPRNPAWIVDQLNAEGPEARTRQELIDPALADRGWTDALVGREVAFRSAIDDSPRRVDYALSLDVTPGARPVLVAFLEAKHDGLPPEHGLEQARLYAEGRRAHIRWVFSTNGHAFVQYDRLTHERTGPVPLDAFPTPQDLARAYVPGQLIDAPAVAPDLRHPASTRVIDRNDPQAARGVFERLLLPTDHAPFLHVLVQSIHTAHAIGPGSWALTLGGNGRFIRLNVGKMEVCAIFPGQGHLVLDAAALTDAARVQAEQYALLGQPGVYATVPSSMLCDFLPEHLPHLLPVLQPSYESLIRKAAQTVRRRTSLAKHHAPGLVQYLREATGLEVPDPVY